MFDETPFPVPENLRIPDLVADEVREALSIQDDWQTTKGVCLCHRFSIEPGPEYRQAMDWMFRLSSGQRSRLLSLAITEISMLDEELETEVLNVRTLCTRRDDLEALRNVLSHCVMDNSDTVSPPLTEILGELNKHLAALDEIGMVWPNDSVIEDDRLLNVCVGDPDAWWVRPAFRFLGQYIREEELMNPRRETVAVLLAESLDPHIAVLWLSEVDGQVLEPLEKDAWVDLAISGLPQFLTDLRDSLDDMVWKTRSVGGDIQAIQSVNLSNEYWDEVGHLLGFREALDKARRNASRLREGYRETPEFRETLFKMDGIARDNRILFSGHREDPSVGSWNDLIP